MGQNEKHPNIPPSIADGGVDVVAVNDPFIEVHYAVRSLSNVLLMLGDGGCRTTCQGIGPWVVSAAPHSHHAIHNMWLASRPLT